MKATAIYFEGLHRTYGELVLDANGLSFRSEHGRSSTSSSLWTVGGGELEQALSVAAVDVYGVHVTADWPDGIYVHTRRGRLAFAVAEPPRWVVEFLRVRYR